MCPQGCSQELPRPWHHLGMLQIPPEHTKPLPETGNWDELHGNEVGMKSSALFSPPHRDQIVDFPTINHPCPSASTFSRPFHGCHASFVFKHRFLFQTEPSAFPGELRGMLGKREQPGLALPAAVAMGKVVPWEGCARVPALPGLEPGQFSSLANFRDPIWAGWEGREQSRG